MFWKTGRRWAGVKLARLNYFGVGEGYFLPCDLLPALLRELTVMVVVCGGNFVEGQSTEASLWKLRSKGTMGKPEGICQSKLPNKYLSDFPKLSFVFVVLCEGSIRVTLTLVNTAESGGGAWKFEVTEMIGEGCVKYMLTGKERRGMERKGEEKKERERKGRGGKERKGKTRKGKGKEDKSSLAIL